MDRRKFVADLLDDRGGLLVVTGIGSATYDVAACGDDPLQFLPLERDWLHRRRWAWASRWRAPTAASR